MKIFDDIKDYTMLICLIPVMMIGCVSEIRKYKKDLKRTQVDYILLTSHKVYDTSFVNGLIEKMQYDSTIIYNLKHR